MGTSSTTQMAKILGNLLKILWCTSRTKFCADTHWQDWYGKDNSMELGCEKVPNWKCLFVHRKQGLFLSVYVDVIKMAGKKQSMAPMWGKIDEERCSWRTDPTSWSRTLGGAFYVNASRTKSLLMSTGKCSSHVFLLEQLKKLPGWENFMQRRWRGPTTWKDMPKNALRDIAGKQKDRAVVQSLKSLVGWSPFQERGTWISWRTAKVCSPIVLKCLYFARMGRPDIIWSVNKLARSVTKSTGACDRRVARFISYIHHTSDYWQYCDVGNTAQHCRLGLFQDSDSAGDLEDSKWTSGGVLCIFGSRTFVPISWMCKRQTSVSHSFYRVSNYFVGCLFFEDGRAICSWLVGRGDRSVTFNKQHYKTM